MADLTGQVVAPSDLEPTDRDAMFAIMDEVYERVDRERFEQDLAGKDEVIVLRSPDGRIGGFSTQCIVRVECGPRQVTGVFSGDTVVGPQHWGSPVLFQVFARRYVVERAEPWWWFLISKGHRTYRMLPTFFNTYWPSRRAPTPPDVQALMDCYATHLYPDDYDRSAGVLAYREARDRLRPGMAGLTEQVLRNPDAAFFAERNPGHAQGHDLVCLAELSPGNLRPRHRELLLG